MLLPCITNDLPYTSDNGPRKRGPIAYARTNMDSMICDSTALVMLNSASNAGSAGAIIEDERGERKENRETIAVAAHFLPKDQFFGFAGSLLPFQVTCLVVNKDLQTL
jgi:hypothetical protein